MLFAFSEEISNVVELFLKVRNSMWTYLINLHYSITIMSKLLSFDRLAYKAHAGKAVITIHAQTALIE